MSAAEALAASARADAVPPTIPIRLRPVEPESDGEHAPEGESVTERATEAEAEGEPDSPSEAEAEAEAEAETELGTGVEFEPRLEPAPVIEPETAPEHEPEPEAEPEPDPEPESEAGPAPEPELDDASQPDVVAHSEAGSDNQFDPAAPALALTAVTKLFRGEIAVDAVDLEVPAGTFFGLVGPNGAGKTTTLSMMSGLLRADEGRIAVGGIDISAEPTAAKKMLGVLPDRLRTFDRLTGRQLLYYYGVLRGLPSAVVHRRIDDLARAFDLTSSLARVVSDYSAGMTKKIMLAGAMIHSPRVLVLDEPFEALDPASADVILGILQTYVEHGGTVVMSSHGMALVERVCSRVAVLVDGRLLAEGPVAEVRGELTLEQRFLELSGGLDDSEELEWLHKFSD
ncbi:ABC transporter ATP-binding protein [Microbacterium sp. LRZ72]|uniref:ABC transporter ATP-binding protein n=1 Tax=Microbacterium sp. LRZ72 TaxID=2942481 RepID=UPI0029B91E91|nr:ABC transporter ATP-binding protein [Microbacterium sp. LRZ72]MDX2377924.1 ABC transporter ATP-binding protein [Microbacterium sp. LRZ72]